MQTRAIACRLPQKSIFYLCADFRAAHSRAAMAFKKAIFIGFVFGAMSSQVLAADAAGPTGYDWNGLFGGVYAGYDFGHSHIFDNRVTTGVTDFDSGFNLGGIEAGLQASWNRQNGNFVWGFAGDVGYNG